MYELDNKERRFTENDLFEFARHCMMKLVSVKSDEDSIPEIDAHDVWRINQILYELKDNKNKNG